MTKAVLPDQKDIRSVIFDYLRMLVPGPEIDAEKERIIANCEKPFALLISAWEIVDTSGEMEMQIWTAFMQDVALNKVSI